MVDVESPSNKYEAVVYVAIRATPLFHLKPDFFPTSIISAGVPHILEEAEIACGGNWQRISALEIYGVLEADELNLDLVTSMSRSLIAQLSNARRNPKTTYLRVLEFAVQMLQEGVDDMGPIKDLKSLARREISRVAPGLAHKMPTAVRRLENEVFPGGSAPYRNKIT